MIVPGMEATVIAIASVSIHGDDYIDVVLAPSGSRDPADRLRARLGMEAIIGELIPGDRVQVEGFLGTVTGLRRIA